MYAHNVHTSWLVWAELQGTTMMTAKVFTGNSQAVRLPKEFRLDATEVEIYRRGDEIVLRELPRDLARAFDILCDLPDDVLADRGDDAPQAREGW
jgi:antitoxin VapB